MAEKIFNGRIVQKHDTAANWAKATSFVPKQGEVIIYDKDSTHNYERIKIGDGVTLVSALPFVDDNKVDKVSGKGLSTNDYTTAEKNKLAGIDTGANKTVVDSALSTTSTNPVQNKVVNAAISNLNTLVGDTKVSIQISNAIASKSDSGHTHDDRYYTESEINTKLNAKANADHTHEISELTDLSGASVNHALTADTANAVAWNNITGKPDTYTPGTHSHSISDVTNLQTTLNAKVPTTRTVNGKALSANITLSAADVGADASGAANTALSNAKAYTDAEITEWVGDKTVAAQISTAIANKSDTGHTHSEYVNQNAFSNVKVGTTTVAADTTTDTLTLVAGSNVTITPDASNDTITIAAKDTVYTHPSYTAKSSGLYKITVDSTGHVSGTAAVAKADITALGIPAQDTTYSAATTSKNGLMSAADKTTLNNLSTLVGDTSVSEQIEAAQLVYVGPTQPTDPNIKVWINTSEEGTGVVPVLPRIATVSLPKANWTGGSSPYSQTVTINTVTSATKIDLQPTVAQIVSLQNDDIALMATNADGVVTIYSFGGKPSTDMTMQTLLTEVSYV